MNTLAYLVYGPKREYQLELTYSVLSAIRETQSSGEALRIVLISDEANRRPDLPIDGIVICPAEFDQWTRGGKYHHEAKVHALGKALDVYQGKIALIDTDTYFTADPARLFERVGPQRSVMHTCEGLLGSIFYLAPLLERLGGTALDYPISGDSRSFNSGVVGLDYADRALLPAILKILHQLHQTYPAFSVEQLAFSIVLDQSTELGECADLVTHYYGYERGFNHLQIAKLFPQFTAEHFHTHIKAFPKLRGFPRRHPMDLLWARWKAISRRQGLDYRFAYLACLSARSTASRSRDDADVWARIAVDVLRRNGFPIAHVCQDFRSMRGLDETSWASPQTKQAWSSYWQALAADQSRGQRTSTVQS